MASRARGSIWCWTICWPCRRIRPSWPKGSVCCRALVAPLLSGPRQAVWLLPTPAVPARGLREPRVDLGDSRPGPATRSGLWQICSRAISCSRSSFELRRERLGCRPWTSTAAWMWTSRLPGWGGAGAVMARGIRTRDGSSGTRHLAVVVNDICLSGQRRHNLVTPHGAHPAAAPTPKLSGWMSCFRMAPLFGHRRSATGSSTIRRDRSGCISTCAGCRPGLPR